MPRPTNATSESRQGASIRENPLAHIFLDCGRPKELLLRGQGGAQDHADGLKAWREDVEARGLALAMIYCHEPSWHAYDKKPDNSPKTHVSPDLPGFGIRKQYQMCLTMNIDIPSIVKHICRKGTIISCLFRSSCSIYQSPFSSFHTISGGL
jgi:hypothetical protein